MPWVFIYQGIFGYDPIEEITMDNTDLDASLKQKITKGGWLSTHVPLVIGGTILALGSALIGYSVGHSQGLTVVGYDADAEQLVEVVQQQKQSLENLNKNLNAAIQERDIAVTNSNDLFLAHNSSKEAKIQAETLSEVYREVLRQRGGLSLTVQNLGVKPLPDNAYEYQLDLVQVSPNRRRASGNVEIRLIHGTEVLLVPLEDKSFNFENYERLTGRWTMPKGFSPQFIEVRLTGSTPVTKRFSWGRGKAVETPSSAIAEIPQAQANAQ